MVGSVQGPDRVGREAVSPGSGALHLSARPKPHHSHSEAHPRKKGAEALSRTFFLEKSNFAVQRPGSKYRINQVHWQVPALLERALDHQSRAVSWGQVWGQVDTNLGGLPAAATETPRWRLPCSRQAPAPLNKAAGLSPMPRARPSGSLELPRRALLSVQGAVPPQPAPEARTSGRLPAASGVLPAR